ELYFTSWSQYQQGGFAYTRTFVAAGENADCEEIELINGCTDELACNYDSLATFNDGTCDYTSCLDECGVLFGDNSSCIGCTDPNATNYDPANIVDDGSCASLDCGFELLYNGPTVVYFEKEDNAYWNIAENRDIITPTCEITRQSNHALYNHVYQGDFYDNQGGSNTLWKNGGYDEEGSWYNNIRDAHGGNMQSIVGDIMTLHILDSDLFFELEFTSWTSNGAPWNNNSDESGGFAYIRTFIAQGDSLVEGCVEVELVYGCTDEFACNYDSTATVESGFCEYISCADECGVPNGDNSTCTDCSGIVNGDDTSCYDECGVPNGDNSTCSGCTDPNAYNYDPNALVDDSTCAVLDCFSGQLEVDFEKFDGTDWDLAENQDFITTTCIITRQDNKALYNIVYQNDFQDNQSGSNTMWKMGSYEMAGTWYNNIREAHGYNMQNIAGDIMTLHILDSDLYFELEFTSWTSNGGPWFGSSSSGGFAYTRTFIGGGEIADCEEVNMIYGCTDSIACNFDSLATYNDGSCDYLSCADDCGVPNGDNSSCSGCMDPSAMNYDPTATISDNSCSVLDCDFELNYGSNLIIDFEKENGADWNLSENQDSITPTCIITRQNNRALYNYVYQNDFWDNQSGSNTEWKNGAYNEGGSWYNNIRDAHGAQMQNVVGNTMTLHILDSDLYFELYFTSWSQSQQGGFAYSRTLIAQGDSLVEDCDEIIIDGMYGCVDQFACNYDSIATLNDGSCEYISCADDCGVPNGDNSSCTGCMDPIAINYSDINIFNDSSCTILDCDFELTYFGSPLVVDFEKASNADWSLSENQDSITPTCIITRQNTRPLYNTVYQNNYWDNQQNGNIQWKMGSYEEDNNWYFNLRDASNNNMQNIVGETVTLHILDSDLYFELYFTAWSQGWNGGGGFAYTRTFVAQGDNLTEDCEEVLLVYGCTDEVACNYNSLSTFNDGSCEYISCADECGVPNGDNSTCTDCSGVVNGDDDSCFDDCGVLYGDNTSCIGCTDSNAYNYDPTAIISNDSCTVLECYQGGLIVNFEKEDNSNFNLPENQDFITPTCIITRQNQSALYNTVYQDDFWDNQFGSNTEWKMGGFDEENSWYNNIRDASNYNMQNIVGETVTLHILDSDLYFELYFTAWTSNSQGGGFAYTRTLVYSGTNIDEDANCDEVALVYGCSDPNSCNYDSIATFNDGSCDYSCYDACGVIYGDNSSCSGCMDPSASNYDPDALVSDDSCADIDCEIDINYEGFITTSFEKEDGADWTLAENQDSITPNCILTRQNQQAIYNIVYQDNFYDNQSGSNTYWKNGPLSSGGGWYNNIRDAHDGQMQTIVGDVMTLHILDADLYFELTFTSWSQNQQGGFAYTRTLVASGSYFLEDCEEVIIDGIYGCTDEIACNFDTIATLDDGTCEYESCADDCGEPNGNNESCSGCMDPLAYNYDPTAIFDNGTCSTIECDFDLNYQGSIVVQFEKEDGADWNLSANRDSITPTCIITRQDNQALYNAVYQEDFWDNQANSNMYWKNGSFDGNGAWYNNIRDAHNSNMQTIVGDIMTLHILDDDLYFEFEFTSWTSGGSPWNSSSELSGGFAYTRTLIAQGSDLLEDC
ncbi:hypothetical protein N9E30_05550, partial [Flavobacteriales bacterium]|nr:hypothetical protein [Flavobacteriales bacterium]